MGNKVDLAESDRKVTREEVEEWIKSCPVTVFNFLLFIRCRVCIIMKLVLRIILVFLKLF